jgi:hypothetical protein
MRNGKLFKSVRAALTLDANQMFNEALTDKSFQKFILDLNKSQLFDGEDSLGVELKDIGGGYSFTTEFLNEGRSFTFNFDGKSKTKTKTAGESPILLDTGEYYDSFDLRIGDGEFTITSDPMKDNDNLEDSYGNNLEGLQDENLQKIIDILRVKFIEEARPLLQAAA